MFRRLLFNEMYDFLEILGMLSEILLRLLLFFGGKFWMTSPSFVIIQSSKTVGFPRVKPVIDREALNIKNLHELIRRHAPITQQNAMGTLPDTMMLTLFI